MRSAVRLLILTITILLVWRGGDSGTAQAAGALRGVSLWLSCENGRNYAIRPLAVSSEGDLVTGRLVLGQRGGVHIRLMPMGGGYRYAGQGVWFDGWRESVYLFLSKYRPIACTVTGGI